MKYIINIVVHFVRSVYIMDLINAWKMENIKISILYEEVLISL